MMRLILALALALALALPLAACDANPAADAMAEAATALEEAQAEMSTVAREVRREIEVGNIRFGANGDAMAGGRDDEAGAQITPEGGLLIDGEPVEVSAAERELLLAYREQVAEIAVAGARVGLQGASLATKAVGQAFRSVLSGDTGEMERQIEAEAEKIQVEALKICDALGPLYDRQQAIVAAMPELGQYATMTLEDVDECRSHEGGMDIDVDMDDAGTTAAS